MTIAQAFAIVDWQKQALLPYVIIDPLNPNALQYLDEAGYFALQRVCLSKDKRLLVVCTPDSKPQEPNGSPVNSPFPESSGSGRFRNKDRRFFKGVICPSKLFRFEASMVLPTNRNISSLIRIWGQTLYFWSGYNRRPGKLFQLEQFSRTSTFLLRRTGVGAYIQRLKVSLFVVNSYLSGNRVTDTRPLGIAIALANGLPRDLPLSVRSALRNKSLKTIRIWVSVLNLYKALKGPYPELPLDTILAPAVQIEPTEIRSFVKEFWGFLTWSTSMKTMFMWSSAKQYFSVSAGPNHPISIIGSKMDALMWTREGPNSTLMRFLTATGRHELIALLNASANDLIQHCRITPEEHPFTVNAKGKTETYARLGKLATKEEAAGKLRVFAIVDYWTQAALEPLHKWIFSLLKTIPTDGTFNQEGALKSLVQGFGPEFYCFDLKAATDMIPQQIYIEVFRPVLGDRIVQLWMDLLTKRDFDRPEGHSGPPVRWTRGQPMGALSSWASLAVVHHLVVQLSAKRAGMKIPFVAYRVLGDDIVIANTSVASAYEKLCAELHIPLQNKKAFFSVVGFLNFANQSYLGLDNISPISLKEEISVTGAPSRAEMAFRMLRRGWAGHDLGSALKLLFHPSDWMKQMRASTQTGHLTPWVGRALRLLLAPSAHLSELLGCKTGAFQAWFLALRPGGGLLAPFTRLRSAEYRALSNKAEARMYYELANIFYLSIQQKNTANLASMKVFTRWAEEYTSPWGSHALLLTTIMTWRDSEALSLANKILQEAQHLLSLARVGPIETREGACARLLRLDSEFPTLPDFRLPDVLQAEQKRLREDQDLVGATLLVELSSFIERLESLNGR